MLRKLKGNKSGFTLVELIVVLVILAILAALVVPALTGYIERARESAAIAEARQVAMAGRASYVEYYVHREETPSGVVVSKRYIAGYFEDLFKTELGMERFDTLRTNSARVGNKFAIETGDMIPTGNGAAKLIENVKKGELGGNCAEFYVKSKTFDSLVGMYYISKDKRYLVAVIFEPENTKGYKDAEPGSYIVTKIE